MALAASDYQQVSEMFARVNFALDALDLESWIACFTGNGRFEIKGASGDVISFYAGKGQLEDYFQRVAANPERFDRIRHWNTCIDIEEVGSGIEVTSNVWVETTGAGHKVLATGVEHDLFERVGGGAWLFSERRIVLDSN